MLNIEKIAGGSQQNLLLYIAVLGILLFVATLLRLKVSLLRKAFIPASLLAGIIGMILGPHVLGVIPANIMSTIGGLPGNMIIIVFACMLLGMEKSEKSVGDSIKTIVPGILQYYSYSFIQIGIGGLLCAFLLTPLFGVDPMFGSVFEIGFAGGHGTAGGMVEVFTMLGWPDGGDVGKTTATIGLVAGMFVGGGLITTAYPAILKHWGALQIGLIFTALTIGLILFCRVFGFWIKHPKLQQRD